MKIEEVRKFTEQIHGWLTDGEGELLYGLASNCTGKGCIVEIGSWCGKSTIWLGWGAKNGNKTKVYAIDPHTGSFEHRIIFGKVWTFDEFKKNIKNAEVDDAVIPIVKTSAEAARDFNEPVELLFIDGEHSYNLAKLDFDLWFPKLVEGGTIVIHDTLQSICPGTIRMAKEKIYNSRHFKDISIVDTATIAKKVEENSLKDRIRNHIFLKIRAIKHLVGIGRRLWQVFSANE